MGSRIKPSVCITSSKIFQELELAKGPFYGDFPWGADAYEDIIVRALNFTRSAFRQPTRAVSPPGKGIAVQQEPHRGPSNSSLISSSVNSKSGDIQILPLPRPGTRGLRSFGTGTSFTSGSPLREITISSPAKARSTRRDRELFA